jgi:hypothetical protein
MAWAAFPEAAEDCAQIAINSEQGIKYRFKCKRRDPASRTRFLRWVAED